MSFGFGTLPGFANMRPEDVASLFSRAPSGVPQGFGVMPDAPPAFTGSVSRGIAPFGALPAPPAATTEAETQRLEAGMMPPAPLPVRVPAAPIRAASLPSRGGDEGAAPADGMVNPPLPPPRPPEFGGATAPASAAPAAPAAAPAGAEPGFMDRFLSGIGSGIRDNSDLLLGAGIGLMSQRGIGPGLGAGLQMGVQMQNSRAARDLAGAKQAVELQKLRREMGATQQLATLIQQKNPGMTAEQAQALAGQQAFANDFAAKNFSAPAGYMRDPNGTGFIPIPGGEADPKTIQAKAQAQAAGTTAGQGDNYNITKLDDGSVLAINKSDPTDVKIAREGQPARPLTDAEREAYGLQKGTGAYMTPQGPKGIGGGTAVTVNNAVNPILKGLGDQFVEGAAAARASADTVRSIQNARSQLDAPGGIFSGQWANQKLALQKVGAFFGATDPNAITNTETFRTQIKPIVLETVKGLGAGSGISNADRDFAQQAVGGDINLDESTIRRVLDITERAARAKVSRHNAMADQMLATQPDLKQLAPMLQVGLPDATPAPAQAAPAPAGRAPYDRSALEQEMRRRGMIR